MLLPFFVFSAENCEFEIICILEFLKCQSEEAGGGKRIWNTIRPGRELRDKDETVIGSVEGGGRP